MSYDAYDSRRGSAPPPRGAAAPPLDPYYSRGPPPSARSYDTRAPPPVHMGSLYPPRPPMSMRDDVYGQGAPRPLPPYARPTRPDGQPDWDDSRGAKRRREPSPPGGSRNGHSYPPRDYPPHHRGPPPPPFDPRFPPPPPPYMRPDEGRAAPPVRDTLDAPDSLPYQVTQRYYTDWLLQSRPALSGDHSAIEAEWSKYLIAWRRRALIATYSEHDDAPWFREKYDPREPFGEMRERLKAKGREGKVESFLSDLEAGKLEGIVMDYGSSNTDGTDADDASKTLTNEDGTTRTAHPDQTVIPASSTQLVIKTIKPEISRLELEEHLSQLAGFDYLGLTDPIPDKKLHRIGFVNFRTAEETEAAIAALKDWTIGTFMLPVARADKTLPMRFRATPASMNEPSRIAKDLEQVRRLALALERDAGDSRGSVAIEQRHAQWVEQGGISKEAEASKRTLDLYLHYLRSAFHTCYYCLGVFHFAEELTRRCPKHVRLVQEAKSSKKPTAAELAWVRSLDERLPLLTDRETVNVADLGGDDPEKTLHAMCTALHKTEGEGKFRCQQCNKLFSALKFVEKHITTKHPDSIRDKVDKMTFFNNYVLDPLHLPLSDKPDNFTSSALKEHDHASTKPAMMIRSRSGGNGSTSLGNRIGPIVADPLGGNKRRRQEDDTAARLPPPPPPEGVRLDPRAERGQRSYADLDGPAGGAVEDIILQY